MTNKLFTLMTAAALCWSLVGVAAAADDNDRNNRETGTQQPQVQPPLDDPAAGGATTTQSDQEYLASLKRCEPLTGDEREKCVVEVRKQHGQM